MAGLYADVPGIKIQFDRDGSAGFLVLAGGAVSALSGGQLAAINGEGSRANNVSCPAGSSPNYCGVIFPQLTDLAGYYLNWNDFGFSSGLIIETSTNTTNGTDGTWVSSGSVTAYGGGNKPAFRSPVALSVAAIKAVRFSWTTTSTNNNRSISNIHLYGAPASGAAVDRLRLWHPTSDVEAVPAFLDWGEAGRSGTYTKTFRIKNNSTTLTANSIVVSYESLSDTSPTVVSMLATAAGGSPSSSLNIGALAPSAISSVLTLTLTVPSNATVGLWRQRLLAIAGSWT